MKRRYLQPLSRFQSSWRRYADTDPMPWAAMTMGQKVVHTIRSTGYATFIAFGISIMGLAFYEISNNSAEQKLSWDIYDDATRLVKDHDSVIATFGSPIKTMPQDSDDARVRNSLSHIIQKEVDGDRLFMTFFLVGPKGKASVHVEKFKKRQSSAYEYVSLVVHGPFGKYISVIDKRIKLLTLKDRLVKWLK